MKEILDYFSASLFIGSKEGYYGPSFNKEDLLREINVFQETVFAHPVKVSSCTYTYTSKYIEDGWEINAITYANSPHTGKEVHSFMEGLAEHLKTTFKQNRITLRIDSAGRTITFESENAETLQCHK